jgi:hypothetical protein
LLPFCYRIPSDLLRFRLHVLVCETFVALCHEDRRMSERQLQGGQIAPAFNTSGRKRMRQLMRMTLMRQSAIEVHFGENGSAIDLDQQQFTKNDIAIVHRVAKLRPSKFSAMYCL